MFFKMEYAKKNFYIKDIFEHPVFFKRQGRSEMVRFSLSKELWAKRSGRSGKSLKPMIRDQRRYTQAKKSKPSQSSETHRLYDNNLPDEIWFMKAV